jgi:hypothetical protein
LWINGSNQSSQFQNRVQVQREAKVVNQGLVGLWMNGSSQENWIPDTVLVRRAMEDDPNTAKQETPGTSQRSQYRDKAPTPRARNNILGTARKMQVVDGMARNR